MSSNAPKTCTNASENGEGQRHKEPERWWEANKHRTMAIAWCTSAIIFSAVTTTTSQKIFPQFAQVGGITSFYK